MALAPLAADRLGWRLRRLRTMSVPEIAWRCTRVATDVLPRPVPPSAGGRVLRDGVDWSLALERFRAGVDRPVVLDASRAVAIEQDDPADVRALVGAAEAVLDGRVKFFGHDEVTLARPVDWHHDLTHDVRWPQVASRGIDHRIGGDPKWIWELNRLQFLPWLAQAWLHTGRDEFAEGALDLLDTWMVAHPVGRGIAWQNAFEVGIRSISITIAVQGLRHSPALTLDRFRRIVELLDASADQCWRRRSRFSSANNHLIGELAGLAVIALLLPELRSAPRWLGRSLRQLAREATRQVLPDGAGAEQAVGYQVFTGELLLVVATLLRAGGACPPQEIVQAIERSARYLAVVVGRDDPAPRYGDDDEGFALRLGPGPTRTVREHLAVVAAFTGDADLLARSTPHLTAAWVAATLGAATPMGGVRLTGPLPDDLFAPDGGLVVLRAAGRRVMMDVGPLGYLSIAAHGHADALAVSLSVDGLDLVGDPGAASYYAHPGWRRAHRSTPAHATVTVDGHDQSVSAGPFLWSQHARVTVHRVDLEQGVVDAEHDGYCRLEDPVVHRRWLVAPPGDEAVLVVDLVEGSGEHEACVTWPLHPSLSVTETAAGHLVTRDTDPVLQIVSASTADVEPGAVRGDLDSDLGWWSDRLEARQPSWLVSATSAGRVPLVVATVLRPLASGSTTDAAWPVTGLAVGCEPSRIDVRWSDRGASHAVVIDTSRHGHVQHTVD